MELTQISPFYAQAYFLDKDKKQLHYLPKYHKNES